MIWENDTFGLVLRMRQMVLKNNKVLFNLDAFGGKNYPIRLFSSLDVKIDCLRYFTTDGELYTIGIKDW